MNNVSNSEVEYLTTSLIKSMDDFIGNVSAMSKYSKDYLTRIDKHIAELLYISIEKIWCSLAKLIQTLPQHSASYKNIINIATTEIVKFNKDAVLINVELLVKFYTNKVKSFTNLAEHILYKKYDDKILCDLFKECFKVVREAQEWVYSYSNLKIDPVELLKLKK